MATKATVAHVANSDGSHSLGATIDGVFVPFVRLPPERVAQLVAQAKSEAGTVSSEPEEER